jgi:hypothetical protein
MFTVTLALPLYVLDKNLPAVIVKVPTTLEAHPDVIAVAEYVPLGAVSAYYRLPIL